VNENTLTEALIIHNIFEHASEMQYAALCLLTDTLNSVMEEFSYESFPNLSNTTEIIEEFDKIDKFLQNLKKQHQNINEHNLLAKAYLFKMRSMVSNKLNEAATDAV
jgi:hypothetical protein